MKKLLGLSGPKETRLPDTPFQNITSYNQSIDFDTQKHVF
jgi:hypothetical protein